MLFLDSASPADLAKVRRLGVNVNGVTINPTLMRRAGSPPEKVASVMGKLFANQCDMIFIQVMGDTVEEILDMAQRLYRIDPRVVAKIDVTEYGLKAMPIINVNHIPIAATLIYEPAQAVLALQAGASYLMPFVNRINQIGGDGLEVVRELVSIGRGMRASFISYADLTTSDWSKRIFPMGRCVSVSINSAKQLVDVLVADSWGVSAPLRVYEELSQARQNNWAIEGYDVFKADWDVITGGQSE